MTTFILASYDPNESALQRTRKTTLVRAHAARAAHVARRENQLSKSLQAVPCSRGSFHEPCFDTKNPANAVQAATPAGARSVAAVFPVLVDKVPAHIGNTRKDPFQCYPFTLQGHEHVLVDYSVNILPCRFYGISEPRARKLTVNFFRDVIFPLTLQDPISFRCFVLGISAVHRADMATVSTTPEMEYQQLLSLRMLREHFLVHPDDCSDAAIAMCLFRSVLDAAAGNEEHSACVIHMQQVARLIRLRGGPQSLRHNPRLLTAVNVYHYVAHEVGDWDVTVSFDSDLHTKRWGSYQSYIEQARWEAQVTCEDFLLFVRNVILLSTVQNLPTFRRLAPVRHTIFNQGSHIVEILSSWERSSLSSGESTRRSFVWTRNQQIYGMSLLLYLNAALWDYQSDVARLGIFLDECQRRIADLETDQIYSIEAAAHAMLLPHSDPALAQAHFDRLWLVGKMLKIGKRLNSECWHKLHRILFSNLTFQDQLDDPTWEDDFRSAALSMPSRSWMLAGKFHYKK